MNIGIIGSGGREHALCKKISESSSINKIFCLPGNPGTSTIATNLNVNISDFKKILSLVRYHKIEIVIVGPEEPLVNGITDFLKKKKVKVFGPSKYASKLEGSKAFVKRICFQKKIPTAKFKICKKVSEVYKFLKKTNFPLVVKADGLAAGKGVTICRNKFQVLKAASEVFNGKFKSSKKIVLEEFLEGEEASYFLVVDRHSFKFFGNAQDHKKVYENDKGPNTGGMGAYSPSPLINKSMENKIISKIVKPTLQALRERKKIYTGFLYVGIMIVDGEPFLIEYNIRMGDPECQVILPRLKTDLVKIIKCVTENKLSKINIKWKKEKCMSIVLCSKGYPNKYKKNIKINNLTKLNLTKNDYIYHAGTKMINGKIVSNGGRVLNIVSIGKSYFKIRNRIISLIKKINWENGFYRRDIGWKVIDKK